MIFGKKKKIIHNPDEVVISYMENNDQRHIAEIQNADANMIARVLNQFDVNRVCSLLITLPKEKSLEIFTLFTQSRKEEIVKRLPSESAAIFMKEMMHKIES
ncbi:MAG: hypothetical protein A2Y40_04360 [Candidatus Margulisbacteria bacterium GWF2_35_9]|nr:MAG: hypothetical protein A2Y40_04360 [Candidatus Margulisbacteria bacterium GWF2_35_9]